MQHTDRDERAEQALFRLLQASDWDQQFVPNSFRRGRRYAADGHVDPEWEVTFTPAGLGLSGAVLGSGRDWYEVQVAVLQQRDRTAVLGTCECPVGYQCKHVVALVADFMSTMSAELGQPPPGVQPQASGAAVEHGWKHWLDLLALAQQGLALDRVEPDRRLGLFIDTELGHPWSRLVVQAAWLRPSKSKVNPRLVDPKEVYWSQHRLSPAPEEGWDPWLEEQLMLLLQVPTHLRYSDFRGSWSSLSRPFHPRVLHALLDAADGPAVFHNSQKGPRLRLGPRRALRTRWQSDISGSQRLVTEFDDGVPLSAQRSLALVGDELWYQEPDAGVMAPVDGSPQLAALAGHAPPLPADKAPWLAEQMSRRTGLPAGLEPPPGIETEHLSGVAPELVLTVGVVVMEGRGWPPQQHELGSAVVAFDYDGISLPDDGTATGRVVREDRLLTVDRDREAEQTLLGSLPLALVRQEDLTARAGLPSPRDNPRLLLSNLDDDLPASLEAWPEALANPMDWWTGRRGRTSATN